MKIKNVHRNLLFGIYALNNDLLNQMQLIEAFQFWMQDKTRLLEEIIAEKGWMNEASISQVNQILDYKIKLAGDEEKLLEEVPDTASVFLQLSQTTKDEDIIRATSGINSYLTQTIRADTPSHPENKIFFGISEIQEKTVAIPSKDNKSIDQTVSEKHFKPVPSSINESEEFKQTLQESNSPRDDLDKTVHHSAQNRNVTEETTLQNNSRLNPIDMTSLNAPVLSDTDRPKVQETPKSVETRIEFKTEFLFNSPSDFLGSGAFGNVFRSEDREFQRKVALKCLKKDHLHHSLTPISFLLEAEINGKLDHPGVLPMYGLGQTEEGVPFYVMKMIEAPDFGKVISSYHEDQKSQEKSEGELNQSLRRLIEHLKSVCFTMQYAHDRGVLHCDLKPQNIMTGQYGETYVVDWGSALLINPAENRDMPAETGPGNHLLGEIHESRRVALHESQGGLRNFIGGSLAYMAPEHRYAHERRTLVPMSPACDIFSIGVILYQILTAKLPCRAIDGEDRLLQDLRMKKADYIPPRALNSKISKPLSAICMKALAAKVEDRYLSAKDLADDLEKWQAGEPVSAYRENFQERTKRWAKRNRTAVSVLTSTFIVITLFSLITAGLLGRKNSELANKNEMIDRQLIELAKQNIEIERREKMAIEAVKEYADAVSENEQLKNRDELQGLRKNLLKSPIDFFRQLNEDFRSSSDSRPESLNALADGIIELAHLTESIGDKEDARNSYAEALKVILSLSEKNPEQVTFRGKKAALLTNLGLSEASLGNQADARAYHQQSIENYSQLIKMDSTNVGYMNGLAGVFNSLGNLERDTGNNAEARKNYLNSIRIREELAKKEPSKLDFQNGLARVLTNLSVIDLNEGRVEEARIHYKKAIKISQLLVAANPKVIQYRDDLALALINTAARDAELSNPEAAREHYVLAIENFNAILKDNPTMTKFQMRLANVLIQLGILEMNNGREVEARSSMSHAINILELLVKDNSKSVDFQFGLAFSLNVLGMLEDETGNDATARNLYIRSIDNYEKLIRLSPENNEIKNNLASVLNNLGSVELPDRAAARKAYQRAIDIREKLFISHPEIPDYTSELAGSINSIALLEDDLGTARQLILKAIELQINALDKNSLNIMYQNQLLRHLSNLIDILPAINQITAYEDSITLFDSILLKFPQIIQINDLKQSLSNQYSWFLSLRPDLKIDQYNKALQIAISLAEASPNNGLYVRSLGAAQYRLGQYEKSQITLSKSLELNKAANNGVEQAADLAFLVMAHHKLDHKADTESVFKRLELLMKQPENMKLTDLYKEAEGIIKQQSKP